MFEQLRHRLAGEANKGKKESLIIEKIRPEEVTELNLNWNSHFNTPSLRQHLIDFPGISWRVRGHTDYIIGDLWRRRADIGQVTETRTRHYRAELVDSLLAEFIRRGCGAVVIGNDEQSDNSKFYQDAGFIELERIVYYEKPDMRQDYVHTGPPITMMPYQPSPQTLADLLEVDHAAFPWLWWNSQSELEYYFLQEGVVIYLAYSQNEAGILRPVGYFGYTLYQRWAHLDRLAVVPDVQGLRVGAYQLAYALDLMARNGARRVTLSTQLNNTQSQRLYEGFGFQRVKSLEYSLIGKWLNGKAM
jgi:ribosomal protein S18 acetylase RimI-like enzyme